MDWMRRQDIKEESPETPTALTPDEPDECYFEEDTSIDEGMVRDSLLPLALLVYSDRRLLLLKIQASRNGFFEHIYKNVVLHCDIITIIAIFLGV